MSGQSITDRVIAARYSLAGEGLARSVCKATTEEMIPPKKKHVDYLVQCTHEPNVSVSQMAGLLIDRSQNTNWVVVFKSLITTHSLINTGSEKFMQFLASNNCQFQLHNFADRSTSLGNDMSPFVRRYSKYINEKAISYRLLAFDFCKLKKGEDGGVLKTMEADRLMKSLSILQNLIDALLEFEVPVIFLHNPVIRAGFLLLFKDLIRLLACYNDGIINLLAKFFDLNVKQCQYALDIYKKFIARMSGVDKFFKVAETIGIDKGDIPDLSKAPSSLVETLETHIKTMEANKRGTTKGAESCTTNVDLPKIGATDSNQHTFGGLIELSSARDQLAADLDVVRNDLLSLNSSFTCDDDGMMTSHNTNPFLGLDGSFCPTTAPESGGSVSLPNVDPWGSNHVADSSSFFSATKTTTNDLPTFDANFSSNQFFGADMSKTLSSVVYSTTSPLQPSVFTAAFNNPVRSGCEKLIVSDLDSSLALLAGNLDLSLSDTTKGEHSWKENRKMEEKKTTGFTTSPYSQSTVNWSTPPTLQPFGASLSRLGGSPQHTMTSQISSASAGHAMNQNPSSISGDPF